MPSSHSPQLASSVQVEITFENPVVFAGKPLSAVITFKNTNEPAPASLGASSSEGLENRNLDLEAESPSQGSSLSNELNLTEGKQGLSATNTRLTRAMSAQMTPPLLNDLSMDGTPPDMHPVATPPNTNREFPVITTSAPDNFSSEILALSQDSFSSPTFTSDQPSPVSPESASSNGLGWEKSGRRLSSQLANSIRELYWSNTSTPEVAHDEPSPNQSLYPSLSRQGSRSRQLQHQFTRSGSNYLQPQRPQAATGLLMGYVQLQGYFVVDDELIDASEFSHVKTQGVVVSSSGEIGYGTSNGTGLLQGLASGLGSLLQIRDNSSPDRTNSPDVFSRDGPFRTSGSRSGRSTGIGRSNSLRSGASTVAKNDAIPIFSTPQSLLFVDLKLKPGESRSYSYSLELPKLLPPSCRAKSIRIHYNLVVGIQKLDKRGRPQPKTTLVPFRVFPYVSKDGQQHTHDLRSPIVLQRDLANVVQLPERHMTSDQIAKFVESKNSKPKADFYEDDKAEFLSYLEHLLSRDNKVPPTPTDLLTQRELPLVRCQSTSEENIKYFSRYQHSLDSSKAIKTRFEIGRSGKRIGTVILSKPVYRVGENIVFIVDYTGAALKTFHITATLETEEAIASDVLKQFKNFHDSHTQGNERPTIDTSAMTRRVYSQATMATYSLSRSTFEFTIPATATPQFSTSSISLKWILKIDFITSPTPTNEVQQQEDSATIDESVPIVASVPAPASHRGTIDNSTAAGISGQHLDPASHNDLNEHQPSNSSLAHSPNSQDQHQRHVRPPVSFPHDSKSPLDVVHISEQGLIAATKETIACESFNCKIPLTVMATNQDISALLEHSVSATRVLQM